MTRIVDVARIQTVDRQVSFVLALSVLAGFLLLNIAIAVLAGTGDFTTGGITPLYFVVGVSQLQAVTQLFPFALGLSVTRKDFYLATSLFALVQAMALGLVVTLGLAVERATGGWGVSLSFFGVGMAAEENLVVRWLICTATLVAFSATGMTIGVIYKRWGQVGVYTMLIGTVAVLIAAAAVVGWQGWWPQVFALFSDPLPPVVGAGYLALFAVLLGGAGGLVLRRATP